MIFGYYDMATSLYVSIFIYLYLGCIVFLFIYIFSTLSVCGADDNSSSTSELYSTALTSPAGRNLGEKITIALSSTPNSTAQCTSSKKATLVRSDSRKKTRKSCYELSPDISDKHVQLLEKKYGGKERANRAARIIQQRYRRWAMKRTYLRLRTQSEARRSSMKGYLSKRNSAQSPSSPGSLSPSRQPIPMNLNLSVNDSENSKELSLRSPEAELRLGRNSAKEEFKRIQADINIDSNFGQLGVCQSDLSIRRVSDDISSIEISKNLLNDSKGQKMIIDEVFHQILSPRKDSISLSATRSDSFRSNKGEKTCTLEEARTDSVETVVPMVGDTEDSEGYHAVDGVDDEESHREKMNNTDFKINTENERVLMTIKERPTEDQILNSSENLSVKEQGRNALVKRVI